MKKGKFIQPSLFYKIYTVFFVILVCLTIFTTSLVFTTNQSCAQGGQTDYKETCKPGEVSENCNPPTLQELEYVLVQLLFVLWTGGGLIWLVYLIFIGWKYKVSGGQPEKTAEAQRMATRWFVGILLFYFSRTIVATIMRDLVADSTGCYEKLNSPGFTFFFSDVCTSGDPVIPSVPSGAPSPVPTSPPIPSPTPEGPSCGKNPVIGTGIIYLPGNSWHEVCIDWEPLCPSGRDSYIFTSPSYEKFELICHCDEGRYNACASIQKI